MLERLLKICETEQLVGDHLKRVTVESKNEEGDRFIAKHGDTFMGKYFDIHQGITSLQDALVEIIFSSEIKHQNIVPLLGFFIINRNILLIYEEPLSEINLSNSNYVISDMIESVKFLHSMRILHGNIHPSSFYLYSDGRVKLMLDHRTILIPTGNEITTDLKMYSAKYRPIECYNKTVCFASDIWALGCTIFNLIYGQDFFPDQNSDQEYLSCLNSWKDNAKNAFGNSIEVPLKWNSLENFSINLLILKMLNSTVEKRPTIAKISEDIERINSELSESPTSTSYILENSNFSRKNCSFNLDTIRGKVKNELVKRTSDFSFEIRSIILIIYSNIAESAEFCKEDFNTSVKISELIIGKRNECSDLIIQQLRRNSSSPFTFSDYY